MVICSLPLDSWGIIIMCMHMHECGLYTHHLSSELIKAVKPHVLLRASIKRYMHYIAAANMLNHAVRLKCVNCIKM